MSGPEREFIPFSGRRYRIGEGGDIPPTMAPTTTPPTMAPTTTSPQEISDVEEVPSWVARVADVCGNLKGYQETAFRWLDELPDHSDAESIRADILDLLTMIVMYRSQYEDVPQPAPRVHPDHAEAQETEVYLTIDKLRERMIPFLDANPPKRHRSST